MQVIKTGFTEYIDRSSVRPVLCNAGEVLPLKCAWNTCDTWEIDQFSAVTPEGFSFAPAHDGAFHGGFVKLGDGEELRASFGMSGYPFVMLIVRAKKAFYAAFGSCDPSASTLTFAEKIAGSPGTTADIPAFWRGNHASYAPMGAIPSIRISGRKFVIALNGYPLVSAEANSDIIDVGMGVYPYCAGQSMSALDLVIVSDKRACSTLLLDAAAFGDSKSLFGWVSELPNQLEYTRGLRQRPIANHSVGGNNSSDQWAIMKTVGVTGKDWVGIAVGTNDTQGPGGVPSVPVATYRQNLNDMVSFCYDRGAQVLMLDQGIWYGQVQTGGAGQPTTNYDLAAEYRSKMARVAADRKCKYLDWDCLGGMWAQYVNPSLGLDLTAAGDSSLRDSIHETPNLDMLIARAAASAVAGMFLL